MNWEKLKEQKNWDGELMPVCMKYNDMLEFWTDIHKMDMVYSFPEMLTFMGPTIRSVMHAASEDPSMFGSLLDFMYPIKIETETVIIQRKDIYILWESKNHSGLAFPIEIDGPKNIVWVGCRNSFLNRMRYIRFAKKSSLDKKTIDELFEYRDKYFGTTKFHIRPKSIEIFNGNGERIMESREWEWNWTDNSTAETNEEVASEPELNGTTIDDEDRQYFAPVLHFQKATEPADTEDHVSQHEFTNAKGEWEWPTSNTVKNMG